MLRAEWIAVAEVLHIARQGAASGWPPGKNDVNPDAAQFRKVAYFATLEAIDRVAILLASRLKATSSRFDEQRFLRMVGVNLDVPQDG